MHTNSARQTHTPSADSRAGDRIALLRSSIDRIDEMLVSLIGERQRLARAVGAAKLDAGLPAIDPAREALVTARIAQHATDHGVNRLEMEQLAEQLVRLARAAQGLPSAVAREAA